MAAMKLALVLVVAVLVVAGSMPSAEGITCGQVSSSLAPCINYLKSGGAPTPQCCAGVKNLNNAAKTTPDRKQACNCIKSAAKSVSGISATYTEALPGKCGVNIPYKLSLNTNCNSIK